MALHLNLYHELQKLAVQRRRDPLKLGLYGIVVVIVILAFYYFYRIEQVSGVVNKAKRMQAQWQLLEPKAKEAQALETQLTANLNTKDELLQSIESRFYWAPLLEKIQRTVPRNVQITSLRGSMAAWVEEAGGKRSREGMLTISGVAAGAEPRKVAEDFRTEFLGKCLQGYNGAESKFVTLEESEGTVQLDGKTLNTATYSLQFHFKIEAAVPVQSAGPRTQKGAR